MAYEKKKNKSASELAHEALQKLEQEKNNKSRFDTLSVTRSGQLPVIALDEIKQHAKTDYGDEIKWFPWLEQLVRVNADARVEAVYISGSSQSGKTMAASAVNAWVVQRLNMRTLWTFPSKTQRDKLVPQQHRPQFDQWNSLNKIEPTQSNSKRSTETYDVGTGVGNFSFSKTGSDSGAAAGTSAVAVTADWLFLEEASQWQPGDDRVFHRRLDNGKFRTINRSPKRYIGTPGAGNGIERLIRAANFEFFPHATCQSCGHDIALRSDGCLLRPELIKQAGLPPREMYFDEDFNPYGYFHTDAADPIASAYFGCPKCESPITDEMRWTSTYKDLKTKIGFDEWVETYVSLNWERKDIAAGFWITPLIKSEPGANLAPSMMSDLFDSTSIADTLQQRFAIPSDILGGGVSRDQVRTALKRVYARPDKGEERVVIMGVDQGRANAYCAVVEYVFNPTLPARLAAQYAHRNVLFLEPITNSDIAEIADNFEIVGGCIDHAPSIAAAAEIAEDVGLCMVRQEAKLIDDYKLGEAMDGGESYEIYRTRYHSFCFRLMRSFYTGRISINNAYTSHLNHNTPKSIVRHLTAVAWDIHNAKVIRPDDEVDDLFFALHFAETAFTLYLTDDTNFLKRGGLDWVNDW